MELDSQGRRVYLPEVGPKEYALIGVILVAIKYALDSLLAWHAFDRPWQFWYYLHPTAIFYESGGIKISGMTLFPSPTHATFSQDPAWFFYTLALFSLPFLAAGLFLTLRRLKSAGLSPLLTLLFFVPAVNLILFLVLCFVPNRIETPRLPGTAPARVPPPLPYSPGPFFSAVLSTLLVGCATSVLAWLGSSILTDYGWGLFLGVPFANGLFAVLIYGWSGDERSLPACLGVSLLPFLIVTLALLLFAVEGLICLLMAAPLAISSSLMGGIVGFALIGRRKPALDARALGVIFLLLPLIMGMESATNLTPPLTCVVSSVVIDAPPERVWPNVVAFSDIPAPTDWVFHTGIAYPTHAVIDGHGVGAVRHCIFSTGEFVEPIEVWDENRLLKFSVREQPPPMHELSPYPHLDTAHLHNFLLSKQGQLKLISLPGGQTRLEGTTWYTNRIWPSPYWEIWSDFIIHRIHLRVLDHIKAVTEEPPLPTPKRVAQG